MSIHNRNISLIVVAILIAIGTGLIIRDASLEEWRRLAGLLIAVIASALLTTYQETGEQQEARAEIETTQ